MGFLIRFPTPWNNRPNSFAEDVVHCSRTVWLTWVMRCRYFIILPVSMSITASAVSNSAFGSRRPAIRRGLASVASSSNVAANATSRARAEWDLVRRAMGSSLLSSSFVLRCCSLVLLAMGSGLVGTAGAFFVEGVVLIWALRCVAAACCALAAAPACTVLKSSSVAVSIWALRVCLSAALVDRTLGSGTF